jgi:hypothetical protein
MWEPTIWTTKMKSKGLPVDSVWMTMLKAIRMLERLLVIPACGGTFGGRTMDLRRHRTRGRIRW